VSAPYPAYVYKGVDLPDYSDQNTNTSWDDSDPANVSGDSDDSLWWDGFYYRDKNGYYYDSNGNFISYSDPSGLSYTSGGNTYYYTSDTSGTTTYYTGDTSGTTSYQSGVTVTESGNNTTTFSASSYSYTPPVSAETYTASVEGAMRLPQSFVFEPYGADPSITDNSVMQPLLSRAFEGLVATDPATGEQVGANAEDFTVSDDGLTYTFDLRSDLKWSDGTPLTAQDYVYTYERILDPETDAKNAALLTLYIDGAEEYKNGEADESQLGIEAVDENTLVIKIKEESDHFLTLLTAWTFSPVQQAAVETGGSAWTQNANSFVSNGPYKVQSITPSQIILIPNQNYTGPNPATQDQVVFDLTN
ncbi:MAG: ABC transporter substrate-binding protein, partial [Oscillospiraceae bacterium]|nr:ABC transporter substrate-binding protein [Oscillospiraceae bacterium]